MGAWHSGAFRCLNTSGILPEPTAGAFGIITRIVVSETARLPAAGPAAGRLSESGFHYGARPAAALRRPRTPLRLEPPKGQIHPTTPADRVRAHSLASRHLN